MMSFVQAAVLLEASGREGVNKVSWMLATQIFALGQASYGLTW